MGKIQENDTIYLDITGGFRVVIIRLMLLSRIFSYRGVKVGQAVYANLSTTPKRIEDVSHLIRQMDLINGLQELSDFGNTRTLRKYYENNTQPEIQKLMNAMEELQHSINLCQLGNLETCLTSFNDSMAEAEKNCNDSLLQYLLPIFHKKFGQKFTMPSLIKWCLENDMLQQALTIFNEKMPGFLFENGLIIKVTQKHAKGPSFNDDCENDLYSGVLNLASDYYLSKFRQYLGLFSETLIKAKDFSDLIDAAVPPKEIQIAVENLFIIKKAAYGNQNFDSDWISKLPSDQQYLSKLKLLNKSRPKTFVKLVDQLKIGNPKNCQLLLKENSRVCTLKHFEELITASPHFKIEPENIEKVRKFCLDYLYIRIWRNNTNHASNQKDENVVQQKKYLSQQEYTSGKTYVSNPSFYDLKDIVLTALKNLE